MPANRKPSQILFGEKSVAYHSIATARSVELLDALRAKMGVPRRITTARHPLRVYFARAMDGESDADILGTAAIVREELQKIAAEMIDPFSSSQLSARDEYLDIAEMANIIVPGDLTLMSTADAILMDMTIPHRNYIGCSCELAYAKTMKIPVFAYVGDTGYEKRSWLIYHSTVVTKSRSQCIGALEAWNAARKSRPGNYQ